MKHNALVSVIIPTFNDAKFIGDTLDSIRRQTYENWSCIVIDDGSSDQTLKVVKDYVRRDSRISYFHQKNQGLPSARNAGLRQAQGVFIQFLDADDLIEPQKLELHVAFLLQHPEVDIVYGDARFFRIVENGEYDYSLKRNREQWMPKISGVGKEILKELLKRNMMVVSSPLIRKTVFDRLGHFNEALIKGYEDWEFWIRCTFKNIYFSYAEISQTSTLIRCHSSQMSRDRIKMLETNLIIRHKLKSMLTDFSLRLLNQWGTVKVRMMLALEKIKQKTQ